MGCHGVRFRALPAVNRSGFYFRLPIISPINIQNGVSKPELSCDCVQHGLR